MKRNKQSTKPSEPEEVMDYSSWNFDLEFIVKAITLMKHLRSTAATSKRLGIPEKDFRFWFSNPHFIRQRQNLMAAQTGKVERLSAEFLSSEFPEETKPKPAHFDIKRVQKMLDEGKNLDAIISSFGCKRERFLEWYQLNLRHINHRTYRTIHTEL